MSSSTTYLKKGHLFNSWLIFINERFPIAEHSASIFFLTLGNAAVVCAVTGSVFHLYNFFIAYAVSLLFFFRLRCFDEIKDYHTDLLVNPGRPLARGLLTLANVKWMFVLITLVEVSLASLLGVNALLVHLAAVAYSYLMYKEFFLGKYLSPHLTTYALTHTFVSVLVAYSIFSQMTGQGAGKFSIELFILGLASWFIFNLFEFARKTYAAEEERKNVPTYTTTFGITGAVLLSLSQIAASIMVIVYMNGKNPLFDSADMVRYLLVASIPLASGVYFVLRKSRQAARVFRASCAAYLIAYYALLSYQGLTGNITFHAA